MVTAGHGNRGILSSRCDSRVRGGGCDAGFGRGGAVDGEGGGRFLGVSPQTVYAWVERRQIPHLRVMGRNIRFLRSDLAAFRATFQQEVVNGTTEKA